MKKSTTLMTWIGSGALALALAPMVHAEDPVTKTAESAGNVAKSATDAAVTVVDAGTTTVFEALGFAKDTSLNTFDSAMGLAGIESDLAGDTEYTIFAPDDAAFEKVPAERRKTLMAEDNRDELRGVLENHIVQGQIKPGTGASVKNLADEEIIFEAEDSVMINGQKVMVKERIDTKNGTIYVIDSVAID